jgi:hypothetical protein
MLFDPSKVTRPPVKNPAPRPTAKAHAGKVRLIHLDQIQRQTSGGDFTNGENGTCLMF